MSKNATNSISPGGPNWKYNGETRQWAKFEATIINDLSMASAIYLLNKHKVKKMTTQPVWQTPARQPGVSDEDRQILITIWTSAYKSKYDEYMDNKTKIEDDSQKALGIIGKRVTSHVSQKYKKLLRVDSEKSYYKSFSKLWKHLFEKYGPSNQNDVDDILERLTL